MIEVKERQRDQFPRLARTGWIPWMSSSSSNWPIVRGQKGCRSGVRWRPQTPPRDPGHRDARLGPATRRGVARGAADAVDVPRQTQGPPLRHVPDLLSQARNRSVTIWDVRAEARQDEKFKLKAALTAGACEHVGWSYRVFAGYSNVLRANLMWLHAYRRSQPWYEPAGEVLSELLAGGTISVGAVLAADAGSGNLISAMWHYLWRGDIDCELGVPITPATVLAAGQAEADRA